jgi:probable HAF family extracellular repeat protein
MYRYLIVPVVLALGLALAAAGAGPAAASKSSPKPTPTPIPTPIYTMTDLGSLGYGVSYGLAINANGQVTGYSYSSTAIQVTCPPQKYGQPTQCFIHPYHAFLYSNGTMTDLGTLGGTYSKGYAINLSGAVVGTAQNTKTGGDSFLWNGKTMVDIGTWNARGINDLGEIAGTCGPNPGQHACVYNNGTLTQLPNPTTFTPIDCGGGPINKSGEVVGTCDDTSSNNHGVLWQNGTPTDLGSQVANAAGINDLGQVVGNAASTSSEFGYLWSNGTLTDLGPNFFPNAINGNGVVVGGPMIYSGGTLKNLNNLIPPGSGFTLDNATAINDNGQIVVNGSNGSQEHAFLLNPS